MTSSSQPASAGCARFVVPASPTRNDEGTAIGFIGPVTTPRPILAVVGNGMVGLRFIEEALAHGLADRYEIVVFGDEPRPAYDRVHLSSYFDDTAEDLCLADPRWYEANGVELRLGSRVALLDPATRTLVDDRGATLVYDECVLATGSFPFVPPVPGIDAAGVFVYRTIDDLDAMRSWATAGCSTAAVVGGGLLGLEAANALRRLGLQTTIVELAPRLMAVQLDDGAGATLRRKVEALGLEVRLGAATSAVLTTPDGRARGLALGEDEELAADLVVFAAGIRPRDQLARDAGVEVGERGGVVVDDAMGTSVPHLHAIGEVACHAGRVHGLVAPGYEMATALARRLAGDDGARFVPGEPATRLKLLGVDVAVAGVATGERALVVDDPIAGTYRKLVLGAADEVAGRRPGGRRRPVRGVGRPGPQPRPGARRRVRPPHRCGRRWRRRHRVLVPQRHRDADPHRHPRRRAGGRRGHQGLHQGRHRMRVLRVADRPPPGRRAPVGRQGGLPRPVRALRPVPPGAVRDRPDDRDPVLRRAGPALRQRPGLHGVQAGGGIDVRVPVLGPHPRRGAGVAPGHQRPLPRQHPARRHLLGGPARARRRDHPRGPHRHRRGGEGLRPLREDHRRPAGRPARRARSTSCPSSGPG